ncbi:MULTISPECIES: carbohydrate ABC transporter permease [Paenibacillus]|jgi:putative aldouronate transport system permease protein|uniref:Carbohydrate ABC transporter permease n=1 Tax=Paenibacillus oceani TaxID=2772510 RepID=A0A927CBK6_9BACL|nr:carbohydrate ABC transporter permease [Paenibacillus oceani]MBD2862885.1 carbohydrate ABC transporter permease [Paenibacillus oceani]MDF2663604.1 binding-protein-dependent transport system inner rane component [Paenibacillus sp.]
MRRSWGDRLFETGNAAVLAIVSLASIFPIYYTFVLSFTDPAEYYQKPLILFPENWTLDAYRYLMSTDTFLNAIGNSAFLATVGTAFSLIVTSGLAYAISRKRLRFRRVIMFGVLFTMLFQPGLIPSYLIVRQVGLIDSIWSLIVPALTGGWFVLLMKGFFDSIPDSLEEAARIDGANEIGIWFRIILPLSLPAMVAFGLFFAVGYWNTFFSAIMFINDQRKWPLQVILQNMLVDPSTSNASVADFRTSQKMPTETLKMAAVVIATVPIMLVYPFLQKHFAKGAMVGSVKE